MAFLKDGTRRLLVAGLEDGGETALEMLRDGKFVMAVDPDESAIAVLQRRAQEARCDLRLHAIACDYMKREFAAGGFDGACFPAVLGCYNEPLVVLRKAARELRVGGRIAFRIRVRPSMGSATRAISRVPGLDRAVARVLPRLLGEVRRVSWLRTFLETPGAEEFLAQVGEVFRVEEVVPMHLVAPLAGALAVKGPGPLASWARKAVPWLERLDRGLTGPSGRTGLAGILLVHASKELQLGKTFQIG